MAKAILVGQFLRARAWWRLDSAGDNPLHVARSVVSLLDTAGYLRDVPDDDPDIRALEAAGCFQGGAFDPGPEGAVIVRDWQLADKQTGTPEDLLSALAQAADRTRPGGPVSRPVPAVVSALDVPAVAAPGAARPGAARPGVVGLASAAPGGAVPAQRWPAQAPPTLAQEN